MLRLIVALLTLAGPAAAQSATIGDIRLERPMLRDTPPNAPVAGGYVTIGNTGTRDDTLVSAAVEAGSVGEVQIHRMAMRDGVMTMSAVAGGVPIPAGGTIALAPGGLHLMLLGLTAPMVAGETYPVTLTFARAGAVTLDFPVMTLGAIRAAGAAAGAGGTGEAGRDAPNARP